VFVPERSFVPDERVTVELPVPVRGAEGGVFVFRVSNPSPHDPPIDPGDRRTGPLVALARHRSCRLRDRALRTLPGHRPVGMCVARRFGPALEGRILVSPRPRDNQGRWDPALMILSNGGRVFWHAPHETVVHDLKLVHQDGRPRLAYYVRQEGRRHPYYELVNRRYEVVTRIFAGNGYRVNGHEMQVTPLNTAYLAIYRRVRVPGTGRRLTDFIVQELDLVTRDVLFEWHALDHVPRWASYSSPPRDGKAWDYFHGNSIEPPQPGGRTIAVSARKTSSVYGIDRATGEVRWILGGKQDQFGLVRRHPGWQFCAQHDARWLPNGDLTLFDNGGYNLGNLRDCPLHPARVLRLRLNTVRKTARLVRSISSRSSSDNGNGFKPAAVGSARRGSAGDTLISWGTTGRLTQVSRRGRIKLKLQFERWTYRATRGDWTGMPTGHPAVAARRRGRRSVDVYASWNGATRIRRWRILAGDAPDALASTGRAFAFTDLESTGTVSTRADYIAVEALTGSGRVLGQSEAVRVR
jgi:hypothetical protein